MNPRQCKKFNFRNLNPNAAEPVGAKRKSRFIGEPKKEINHESTKGRKHEKKDKLNFVLSRFRVFVMKIFFHKMQRYYY
jgi:hypothetical protein